MIIRTRQSEAACGVDLTPIIDMVFLLLIFFLVATTFHQTEREMNIALPVASSSTPISAALREIIINVTAEGKFIVNQKLLDADELENMLVKVSTLFPDQPVIIRADENTMHKHIVRVLDACAGANIWDISFAATTDAP